MPLKKLIEADMPVFVINTETEKEKTARMGLPSNVHLWWSRRSMAAARSTLFASLVDDPSAHPGLFPSEEEQNRERERLLKITEELAKVENVHNTELLEIAKNEIQRYTDVLPVVFDPFVGGGAIPVEAQRLGLGVESADLNPVAVMITTLVTDVPARFANMPLVSQQEGLDFDIPYFGASGFSKDVYYYGKWILAEANKKIGRLYPLITNPVDGKQMEVSAWIWARTVKCPNPKCGCSIPLSSSYSLSRKKGREVWVEPIVEKGNIKFRIHRESNHSVKEKPKVAKTAVFKCPACGEITADAYIKECGRRHQIQSQLIALAANDGTNRIYIEPTEEQEKIANISAPTIVPHGKLPDFPHRFSPPLFGLTDYADLFTNRQLVFLTTMMDLAKNVQKDVEQRAIEKGLANDQIPFSDGGRGAFAYAQAIRIALVLTISKLLDRCSGLCSWDSSSGGSLRSTFSRASMPMIWDYAEGNPFSSAGGSFANALARTCEVIAGLPAGEFSHTTVADCTLPNNVRNAIISTEPPYYDKASYADISDFFYVWLKYGLQDLYPEWFATGLTAKEEELTAFSYRWSGDKKKANAFYAEGLNIAFKNMYASASENYPSSVCYQYKHSRVITSELSEWETFVTAVYNSGFTITATWPLGRKYESSVLLAETRGIPITVVLRKRDGNAPLITRRNFVASVKKELPLIIENLKHVVNIRDLRVSVIGQALNIFTRNSQVLDASGTKMNTSEASRIIEEELDTLLESIYKEQA